MVNEAARLVTVDAGIKTVDLLDYLAGRASVVTNNDFLIDRRLPVASPRHPDRRHLLLLCIEFCIYIGSLIARSENVGNRPRICLSHASNLDLLALRVSFSLIFLL